MTMIERVARATHNHSREHANSWDELLPYYHNKYRQDARAAIAAMREPTEAMINAGDRTDHDVEAATVWQAMIDEALK
jgi:hypothetical protein